MLPSPSNLAIWKLSDDPAYEHCDRRAGGKGAAYGDKHYMIKADSASMWIRNRNIYINPDSDTNDSH